MMNFHISSEKIGNPQLVELLNLLSISFKTIDLPFFVIGATARDIVLRHFAGIASLRKTEDLDIAIAIPNWEKYDEVSTMLQNAGLVKDKNQKLGGIWLAYDLCPLLNRKQLEYYANVLMSEVNKRENSLLINQMHEQSPSLSYELLSKTISEIAKIFYEPD
jgi:hypothetical protein